VTLPGWDLPDEHTTAMSGVSRQLPTENSTPMSGAVRIADVQAKISEQHHGRPLTFFRVRREWLLPILATERSGHVV
jgi:hypothetical protein